MKPTADERAGTPATPDPDPQIPDPENRRVCGSQRKRKEDPAEHDGCGDEAREQDAAQLHLVGEIQEVYQSQGVTIHDRHVELIGQQLCRFDTHRSRTGSDIPNNAAINQVHLRQSD